MHTTYERAVAHEGLVGSANAKVLHNAKALSVFANFMLKAVVVDGPKCEACAWGFNLKLFV
jgi:hypothetical protein